MEHRKEYIAVFDSGVGGVSVLRQLRRYMPHEHYIYFGDCANAPYGSRPTQEVRRLTLAVAERLLAEYPVKALVVACNTATAAAIEALRSAYPERIIVGIEPALKLAADLFPGGRIGVMATEVTLREEKFDQLLGRFPECSVARLPAPGLVELIEAGKAESPQAEALLHSLLDGYIGKLDALVLGCTHYPFASRTIGKVMGEQCLLLDGGEGTARETMRRLEAENRLEATGEGSLTIRSSLDDEALRHLAAQYI